MLWNESSDVPSFLFSFFVNLIRYTFINFFYAIIPVKYFSRMLPVTSRDELL